MDRLKRIVVFHRGVVVRVVDEKEVNAIFEIFGNDAHVQSYHSPKSEIYVELEFRKVE